MRTVERIRQELLQSCTEAKIDELMTAICEDDIALARSYAEGYRNGYNSAIRTLAPVSRSVVDQVVQHPAFYSLERTGTGKSLFIRRQADNDDLQRFTGPTYEDVCMQALTILKKEPTKKEQVSVDAMLKSLTTVISEDDPEKQKEAMAVMHSHLENLGLYSWDCTECGKHYATCDAPQPEIFLCARCERAKE